MRFETYIKDAILWSNRLCLDPRLSKLVIIGHSEGSLIGMVVCRKTNAAGYVSIAGPAYPASELILTQLKTMLPDILFNKAQAIVRSLTKNKQTDEVPYELYPLFRPSVQPYFISWFNYNPLSEIAKLKVPILILQGSNDIQVAPENAKLLGSANSGHCFFPSRSIKSVLLYRFEEDHRIGETILRSEHIAIVGTGRMGRGIAQIFAARGHEVVLFDRDEDALEEAIVKIWSNLINLSEHGLCLREEIERTIEQIKPAYSLKEAVASARFVVESAAEELEVKQDLFHQMEELCSPITILATKGSLIRITEAAAKTKVKEQVIGTHFWPPPYLVPLVEVVGGRETSREVKEYTCNILKSVGKHPVMVEKDVPGLVGSRLQHALRREAIAIVEQGIADPKAVDEAVKNGLSLRLSVSGPLENAESAGLDRTFQVPEHFFKFIGRF